MNITHSSKQLIKSLLEAILQNEQVLELARQQFLKEVVDKNIQLRHCFQYVSKSNELINVSQLQDMLDCHIVQYTKSELDTYFVNLGKKTISYQDLLNFLLPSSVQSLKSINPVQLQPSKQDISFGYPDLNCIQLMVYIFEKELEMIRKIGAYIEQIQERWDLKNESNLLAFLCPKGAFEVKEHQYINKLLRTLQLDLYPDQLICILRRLDKDQDGDIGIKDWTILLHPEQVQATQKKKEKQKVDLRKSQQTRDISIDKRRSFKTSIKSQQSYQIKSSAPSKSKSPNKIQNENNNPNQKKKLRPKKLKSPDKNAENKQNLNSIKVGSKQQIVDFAQMLKMISDQLEGLEELKNELSLRADFTVQEAFLYFDLNLDGQVDIEDFRIACFTLGIDVTTHDILNFFAFLAVKTDSLIYQPFHKIFMPKTPSYASILSDRSLNNQYDQNRKVSFTYETKKQIAQLIATIIKTENQIVMHKDKNLNLQAHIIFMELDKDQDGVIFMEDFYQVDLKEHQDKINIPFIFQKFDTKNQGCLTLEEFQNQLYVCYNL